MRVGHGLDDREAQAAAGASAPGAAAREPLEHPVLLRLGNARPAIRELDQQFAAAVGGDADLHWILVAGIVAGVVEQVGEGLAQRDRVA